MINYQEISQLYIQWSDSTTAYVNTVLLKFFPQRVYMSLKIVALGVKQPQWFDSEQNLFVLRFPMRKPKTSEN